jgi:UPF0042 nucleotide-binding protein
MHMGSDPGGGNFPVVVVSGLSGAGKSTAINVFEDMGFYCVDGLPLGLLPDVIRELVDSGAWQYHGLAVGLDLRQKNFDKKWDEVRSRLQVLDIDFSIVFLEADLQELVHRYAQTRRPHPLESGELGLEQALVREKERLSRVREESGLVLDTTSFSIHDLRRRLQSKWEAIRHADSGMRLHVISFGFKHGVPLEADMVLDLRFLPNPFFVPELRPLTGEDEQVYAYTLNREPGISFLYRFKEFLEFLIPLYADEGRYRLTLALGCTGGMHRSVAVARSITGFLREKGYALSLEHRHIHLG